MKKKNFGLIALLVSLTSLSAFADPIVELAAPRVQPPKSISEEAVNTNRVPSDSDVKKGDKSSISEKLDKNGKPIVEKSKQIKKKIHKRPVVIKIDYDEVSKLIEYNYFDEADAVLQGAIKRNPKDIKAQSLRAVSLAKQCKLDPAQKELDVLLRKYPDNSNLHYAQGVVYYQRTTSSNMFYRANAANLFKQAQDEFTKAAALDKNNARAYNALGVLALKQGNEKLAAEYFNKSLAADKTYSLAIDNLGTLDFNTGKQDSAQKKFLESLKYNTQNTAAMYHLAQIYLKKGDCAKALIYLNDALAINSNSPAIYNLMGKAYALQGNEPAAINAFKKSVEVKPEFFLSYLDLANIYEKRGDNEFAIEQLKTALSINPDYNEAKLKIADISLSDGDFNQALSYYAQIVGVDGYSDIAVKGLANSYFAKAKLSTLNSLVGNNKDLYEAYDAVCKAISASPSDMELHLAKLKISKLINLPEETKVQLNKIVASPSNDLMSYIVKGEAYLAMNDYVNSKKMLSDAIKLSKTEQEKMYLSEILTYHKQYDLAQNILEDVLRANPINREAMSDLDYIQKAKKHADSFYQDAKVLYRSKNFIIAKDYLNKSLSINPNNADAYLMLAQISEKLKDSDTSLLSYKAYLGLKPEAKDAVQIQRKIRKLENSL